MEYYYNYMRNSYYNRLAIERTGHDLPSLLRQAYEESPRQTASHVAEILSDKLGEHYGVRCVRYLSKISGVDLAPECRPFQRRGRGKLQLIIVKYMDDYMRRVGIQTIDYDHVLYLLAYFYEPQQINIGDLVRQIGFKDRLSRNDIRNMYLALAPDVEVERYFNAGPNNLTRVAMTRMENNTRCAQESLIGRCINNVININSSTSLIIFDDGTGVVVRPDIKLGTTMRIESADRVQSYLHSHIPADTPDLITYI